MPDLNALKARADSDNFIQGTVPIGLFTLIDSDLEAVLDYVSEQLTGTLILTNISFTAVAVTRSGEIVLKATGDISDILDEFEGTPYDTSAKEEA